ncbi:MAG: hypothetical protein K1X92_18100 [Bacteroidia bacterium]|nr:hypothetical protein [Bacteroidia bacterium]
MTMRNYIILILTVQLIPNMGISQTFLPSACDWVREEKKDSVYIFSKDCCTTFDFWADKFIFNINSCMDSIFEVTPNYHFQILYKYHKKTSKGIYIDWELDDSMISTYCETKRDLPHGKCITYYSTGKECIRQHYRCGKKHGRFIIYDLDGHIEVKRYYINGLLNGYDYAYSYKEKMMSKQFYIMGRAITRVKVKPYKVR